MYNSRPIAVETGYAGQNGLDQSRFSKEQDRHHMPEMNELFWVNTKPGVCSQEQVDEDSSVSLKDFSECKDLRIDK